MKRWRHFITAILILPVLAIYIWFCLSLADLVIGYYWLFDLLFYICFGLLWLYPASLVTSWLARHEAK